MSFFFILANLIASGFQNGQASSIFSMLGLLAIPLILYSQFCVMIKRAKDLEMGIKLVYCYYAFYALALLLLSFSGFHFVELQPVSHMDLVTLVVTILFTSVAAFGVYFLFIFGFLRGTIGDNKYGPDPLGEKLGETQFED